MIDSIKITSLTNIGANLSYTSIFPVVNITGTPITNKANLQIIGNYILSQAGGANMVQAAQATLAQSVVNAAQPNITSVGTLSISTLKISGGVSGYILRTDGAGNLTWIASTATVSGSNTQIQFNNAGSFGSSANLTYNNTTGIFTAPFVAGNGNGLSNIQGANVSGFVPNANVANTAFAVAGANVSGFVPNANVANTAFAVAAANVSGLGNISNINLDGNVSNLLTGNGTYVAIPVVPTVGNIATINLDGSNSNVLYGNGVFAAVAGGNANTGNVTFSDQIVIGTGSNDGSGGLYLAPGSNSIANSALQYLRVRGGDVVTHIHLDTGNNAFYDQYFGDDAKYVKLELGDAGNVVIGTDDANGNLYTWSFTSDGNLILAGGDSVIQSIANSSLDPNNANVSTMVFTPDQNYTSQSLVIDPTGPSHIHLRAPGANIDEPDANIFLGGEESSFEVGYYNGAAPNLFIHSNNNTWTFDTTGILLFPRDTDPNTADPILAIVGGANPSISAIDASLAGPANLGISALTTIFSGVSGDEIKIYPDDGEISSTANLQIWANSGGNTEYSWTFGTDGSLTLPIGVSIDYNENVQYPKIIADSGKLFSVQGQGNTGSAALAWTIDPNAASQYAAVAVTRAGGDDLAKVVLQAQSNSGDVATAKTWQFSETGNLTLPLGSIVYETNIPDQSLSGSAIALKPIGGTTANQQLLIYPTAADGDHIHMTSGNLYATELFLGSDNLYVKLANTGNVVINSNDGNSSNAMWTFGTDGNLTLPGNLVINGLTNVFGSNVALLQSNPDLPLLSVSSGSNGGVSSLWVEDIGNVGTSNIAAVYTNPTSGSGIVRIAVGQNGGNAGPNLWDFGTDGNLTIPGSSGGFIKTVANASIGIAAVDNGTNNPAQLLSMTNAGAATSIVSAYATNATIQTNATGAINTWAFDSAGNLTLPTGGALTTTGNISANNFTGNGGGLSNVATKVEGSWTLASGNNTVSISVPGSGTYTIWINGNIPNGIITYTATAVVTNTNVPVLGDQYGWYYAVGNALVLTSIPNQFVGTAGAISNVNTYLGNTANVFTFGITNNSGNAAVVNYGYTKL